MDEKLTKLIEREGDHPRQTTYFDDHGVRRFRPNAIIEWLFETGRLDLNRISAMTFSDADRRQIAQLLGYSVSGYDGLPYVYPADPWPLPHACICGDAVPAARPLWKHEREHIERGLDYPPRYRLFRTKATRAAVILPEGWPPVPGEWEGDSRG